jgi:hypothetical protein
LAEQIRGVKDGTGPAAADGGILVLDALDIEASAPDPRESYWIAWRCFDQSGVARKVADLIYNFVNDACKEPPNLQYAISRVLANRGSCAGKLKLTVPATFCSLGNEGSTALKKLLQAELPLEPASGLPADVLVQPEEPNEEPWASLLFV